ncbi:17979_t:CDS:2, partial [Cetraspora pellucida]
AELRSLIETINIVGGGLKNYLKTRWTTASNSIENILHLEKVLKKNTIEPIPNYLQELALKVLAITPNS